MSLSLATSSLVRLSPQAESASERALLDELVSRLRSRDDVVIDRVLRELVPQVRRWLYRHLGPRNDIEDATQDALSEIASALHRFEGRSSLVTLAHRIALRTSYRYYRRPARSEPALSSDDGIDLEKQVAARRALARLHDALAELPDRRRAAFVLCAVEGMEPAEAAEVLDVSKNAMRSLLCRARAELEAILVRDDELGRSR
jgi:RNA polymerase sigma-70 factor (ECF subfamily)